VPPLPRHRDFAGETGAALERFAAHTQDALDAVARRDVDALGSALDARAHVEQSLMELTRLAGDLRARAGRDVRAAAELRAARSATARIGKDAARLQAKLVVEAERARDEIGIALADLASASSATASYAATPDAQPRLDVRL
jgi:hypothetical protein